MQPSMNTGWGSDTDDALPEPPRAAHRGTVVACGWVLAMMVAAAVCTRSTGSGLPRSASASQSGAEAMLLTLAEDTDCRDEADSGQCGAEVDEAIKNVAAHPDWYPDMSKDSSRAAWQAFLHQAGHESCPRPCEKSAAPAGPPHHEQHVSSAGRPRKVQTHSRSKVATNAGCRIVTNGEPCHDEIEDAMRQIVEHSDWYPGLTEKSSFADFQAFLHKQGHEQCPSPCSAAAEQEIGENGCHTATAGDECFSDVDSAMNELFAKHPKDYPGFTQDSTFEDFQAFLHLQGHNNCALPCDESAVEEARARIKKWKRELEKGYSGGWVWTKPDDADW